MQILRVILISSLCVILCSFQLPLHAGIKPLGILTLAYGAHLNASDAFVGLSVFDGERISTDPEGKLSLRVGGSVLTLSEQSSANLQRNGDGAHVEMGAGSLFVSSAEKNPLEVHVEDALVRAHGNAVTQAQILIYAPKVLQINARQGSLDFFYHGEFRVLPEGQIYRIYLESEADPQGPAGAGAGGDTQKAGMSKATKVTYFIVSGVGAGLAAWGIHDLIESSSGVESPAKP